MWDVKAVAERQHQITNAVQLQAFIEEKLGVILTVQTVRTLMRNSPVAPRAEMIQLLCDALDCRSDEFYVFTPNPVRAEQWARDRAAGKNPSPLYLQKAAEPAEAVGQMPDEPILCGSEEKFKSLRSIFSDPRMLYKDKLKSRE